MSFKWMRRFHTFSTHSALIVTAVFALYHPHLRVDEIEGLLSIFQRLRQLLDSPLQLLLLFRRRLPFHSRNSTLQLSDLEVLAKKNVMRHRQTLWNDTSYSSKIDIFSSIYLIVHDFLLFERLFIQLADFRLHAPDCGVGSRHFGDLVQFLSCIEEKHTTEGDNHKFLLMRLNLNSGTEGTE